MQKKHERKESKFQLLFDVKKIRNKIVSLCLRDFGVKSRSRSPEFYTHVYEMEEGDKNSFLEILEKYGVTSALDTYPEWYLNDLRSKLIDNVFKLVEYVEYSNVYPTTVHECDVRRDYQNKALACLFDIYQWLDLASLSLPLNKDKFEPYFEDIEKAIASIKALRKSDNKVRKKLQEAEREKVVKSLDYLLSDNYNINSKMLDRTIDCLLSLANNVDIEYD